MRLDEPPGADLERPPGRFRFVDLRNPGIKQGQVEKVLKRPIKFIIPNAPNEFTRAINFGEPLVCTNLDSPVTAFFEDVAYAMSKEGLKNIPPAAPTAVWKRVTGRMTSKK